MSNIISYIGLYPIKDEFTEMHGDLFDPRKRTILVTNAWRFLAKSDDKHKYNDLLFGAKHYNTVVYIKEGHMSAPCIRANIDSIKRFFPESAITLEPVETKKMNI